MRATVPTKKHNLLYSSKIDLVTDLMAASVIPLFYAADQNEELLISCLEAYSKTNQEAKKITDHYFNVLGNLHILFQTYPEKNIEPYKIALTDLTKKIENDCKVYQRACEKYKPLLDRLKKNNEPLNPQDSQIIKTIDDLNQKINLLVEKKRSLESTIQDLESYEIRVFIEEVMLFALNFSDGPDNLNHYFQSRPEIIDFFFQHHQIFNEIATVWIKHITHRDFPIKNHPLPMYLCPFNANEAQFKHVSTYKTKSGNRETTWKRVDSSYHEHLITAGLQMPLLLNRMVEIQASLSKSTEEDKGIETTFEEALKACEPRIISEKIFFKPKIILQETSDENPPESKENHPPSSGRRTNSNRMFQSKGCLEPSGDTQPQHTQGS